MIKTTKLILLSGALMLGAAGTASAALPAPDFHAPAEHKILLAKHGADDRKPQTCDDHGTDLCSPPECDDHGTDLCVAKS